MGLPDSMLSREPIHKKVKTIYIVYATHASWRVAGEVFIKAGIALLSAIQLIESSGTQVKLDCIFYAGKDTAFDTKEVIFGAAPLKDYSEGLNLQKLCFPIAHPSMLRRIGFKFLETVPGMKSDKYTDGYGNVVSRGEIEQLFKTNTKAVILDVGTIRQLGYNVESIIKYIETCYKEIE